MKLAVIILLLFVLLFTACSEDEPLVEETISKPDAPSGPDSVYCGEEVSLKTGGAVSSLGHSLDYRFDFDASGEHDYGEWSAADSAYHEWSLTGAYSVRAQARCRKDQDKISPWSDGMEVEVVEPPVSKPLRPGGPSPIETDEPGEYRTGGAVSIEGDPVEYRFDFDAAGARDTTTWSGQTCVTHSWPVPGTYRVRAQARSELQTEQVSPWSSDTLITVNSRFVTTPSKPLGPEAWYPENDGYCTGGAVSSLGGAVEYQMAVMTIPGEIEFLTEWSSDSCFVIEILQYLTPFQVKARARAVAQSDKKSAWSEGLSVSQKAGERPVMQFATLVSDGAGGVISRPYVHGSPDTVGMFEPFSISYQGLSSNGSIQAYYYYQVQFALQSVPFWDTDINRTVHYFPNRHDPSHPHGSALPSGDFYFIARCLDNAGYASEYDLDRGKGVCRVTVNYEPDTRIPYGRCKTWNGEEYMVYFNDGQPDTLPYNSLLTLYYRGWDDPRDSLQYTNPVIQPRYQFLFERWGYGASGGISSYRTPWFPIAGAEDTDCGYDIDSTTMRVGTFDYEFSARAFDEQYRSDGSPDRVSFCGNFPPVIDTLQIGFWDPDILTGTGQRVFREIETDTLFFGWIGGSPGGSGLEKRVDRGDTLYINDWIYNTGSSTLTKYYRFVIRGEGHDDSRDPAWTGTGIKGWQYFIDDQDGGNYLYQYEGEWRYDSPIWDPESAVPNLFECEITVKFTIPFDQNIIKGDSLVRYPPDFFGEQVVTLRGGDIGIDEIFYEGIRATSPEIEDCVMIKPGEWVLLLRNVTNYSRKAEKSIPVYFRMVM
ncbi:MAG: hypothetical protein JXB45_06945 [Candidatus Krumholzibacteriota bacterium]|nr:hypothetical protein [Candidatus Krumholzibacteriota bacterium]